jgi:hypothetical protein
VDDGGWQSRTRRETQGTSAGPAGLSLMRGPGTKPLDEFLLARALEHDAPS